MADENQIDPNQALLKKADQLRLAGSFTLALEILEQLIKDNPFFSPAKLSLGRVFFENGNLESARITLEEFCELIPDHPLANKILAKIYIHFLQPKKALEKIHLVLGATPNDTFAKRMLEQVEEQFPDEPDSDGADTKKNVVPAATATMAEIYRSQGHLKEALEIYKELNEESEVELYSQQIEEIELEMNPIPSLIENKVEDVVDVAPLQDFEPVLDPFSEPHAEASIPRVDPLFDASPDPFESKVTETNSINLAKTSQPEAPSTEAKTGSSRKHKLERLLSIVQQHRGGHV